MAIVLLYFDGSCEPTNPGGIGTFGYVIRDLPGRSEAVFASGRLEPISAPMTNNYAEYAALGRALAWLLKNARSKLSAGDELVISGDSKLVIEQLTGKWNCNSELLRPLLKRCKELLAALPCKWSAVWIPRDQNATADLLSQAAYVGFTGDAYPERPAKKEGAKS